MAVRTILAGGHVLTMDADLGELDADVLVEDGVIRAVAPGLVDAESDPDTDTDTDIIDVSGRLVLPGLIDTHRHLWQAALRGVAADWTLKEYLVNVLGGLAPEFTPDDLYIGDLLGAQDALDSGVTTVLDFNQAIFSPEHGESTVSGLLDSGIRAVCAVSLARMAPTMAAEETEAATTMLRRMLERAPSGGLLSIGIGGRSAELAPFHIVQSEVRLARDLGIQTASHVGLGLLGRRTPSIGTLNDHRLLGPDLLFIHCNTSSDDELRMLADNGSRATVSPRIEMLMGHGYPATGRLLEAGVQPTLSIDVVTGVSGNMFAEMETSLAAETLRQHTAAHARGEEVEHRSLTARDALEWATIAGAHALGLGDVTGSLSPGKDADIIVLDLAGPRYQPNMDPYAAVLGCSPADVESVFVRGVARKRDRRLVDEVPMSAAVESRTRIEAAAQARRER